MRPWGGDVRPFESRGSTVGAVTNERPSEALLTALVGVAVAAGCVLLGSLKWLLTSLRP